MNALHSLTLGFFNFDNPLALIVVAIVALLVFGKRLPEVGRSLGRGIVEFKKGLSGVEDDVNRSTSSQTPGQIQSTPPAQLGQQATPASPGQQAAAPVEQTKPRV